MHTYVRTYIYIYTYKQAYIHPYVHTYIIHTYIHTYVRTYIRHPSKMLDEVGEGKKNALNLVVTTTERSGNMKKELKETIFERVSTLRNLFVKLKTIVM